MKKLLLTLALLLAPSTAFAQCNGLFPPNTVCGNNTGGSAPPFPIAFTLVPVGGPGSSTVGDIAVWNNLSGTLLKDVPPLQIFGTQSPNLFLSGPTSGAAAFPTFRPIGMSDLGLTPSNGGIVYSSASALALLAGTATPGQCLLSGASTAPTWGSCSGAAAVSSVTAANTTLTISPTTGAVVAGLNLANANNWTGAITITTNSGNLNLDTPGATEIAALNLKDNGVAKWAILNFGNSSDLFAIFNQTTSHNNIQVNSANDNIALAPIAGNVGIGSSSAAYLTDIRNNTNITQLHLAGDLGDDGLYLSSAAPNQGYIANAAFNGTSWIAKTSTAGIIGFASSSNIDFWQNTGTTTGVAFAPNLIATITPSGVFMGGGGSPWVDVKSGSNGCAAAVGNNSTNDQPAIQCQINWMAANFPDGILWFPCANGYKINSGLTVTVPIVFDGPNPMCSVITTGGADFTAITWKNVSSLQRGGGLRNIWVQCQQTGTPATPCVEISDWIEQKWFTYYIWGGNPAFFLCGATTCGGGFGMGDNTFTGGNVHTGSTSGISVEQYDSFGNNFYDSKFDLSGQNSNTALFITNDGNNASGISENYMSRTDLSGGGGGNYTYSLQVNDSVSAQTVLIMNYAVFGGTNSPAMNFGTFRDISLGQIELGQSGTVNIITGQLHVIGSMAGNGNGGAITFSGGTRSCAGNIGVTC